MSGGRFLVSDKDVSRSENIFKKKSLVKEGFDSDPLLKVEKVSEEAIEHFLKEVKNRHPDFDSMQLNSNSKEGPNRQCSWIHCTCIRKVASKLLRGKL